MVILETLVRICEPLPDGDLFDSSLWKTQSNQYFLDSEKEKALQIKREAEALTEKRGLSHYVAFKIHERRCEDNG